jgi:tetratricopeptide (TPR) repeat protein
VIDHPRPRDLHGAHAAERLMHPAASGVVPEQHAEQADALAWLIAERPVLLVLPRQAVDAGFDTPAWQLAWVLDTFLYGQGHWRDLTTFWQSALDAAGRLGDQRAEEYAHRSVARACIRLSRFSDATGYFRRALDLYDTAGDRAGQAYVHHGLAMVFEQQRRPGQALGHARQALALYEAAGHRAGQARALNAVGWYQALLGHHRQAVTACRRALTVFEQLGDRTGEAHASDSLGYAYHLGRRTHATDCYRRALTLFRGLEDRYAEAVTLTHLGDHQRASGDRDAARSAWQQPWHPDRSRPTRTQ